MSSSWSDLPLDLLISIRNKLHNADLSSFRLVCSQWHSASPIPNLCPRYYFVSFDNENNIIHLALYLKNGISRDHFISLPFSLSSPLIYFDSSNGWLVFTYKNEILYLFDPVSNRKFILPPLNPMLLRYYKKVKPIVNDACYVFLRKVVVSSNIDAGIAAAGIVEIGNQTNLTSLDRRFIFCRHGDCQRWSLLMEGSKGIIDIALAGDNRFYALGKYCELYMLDERPPLIKLKKIKLWLPKHILDLESANIPPIKRLRIKGYGMKKSGETDLKVYGYCRRDTFGRRYISLKINVAKLNGYSNNIDVACDAKWSYGRKSLPYCTFCFTPLPK